MSRSNVVVPSRKSRVTGKDVALLAITDGMQAVRDLHTRSEIAAATFDNAVELLANKPELARQLADLSDELHPAGSGERGRPAAKIGDTRRYSVQQVNGGSCFIRLPVDLLGATKEREVTVAFQDGKITVTM